MIHHSSSLILLLTAHTNSNQISIDLIPIKEYNSQEQTLNIYNYYPTWASHFLMKVNKKNLVMTIFFP